MIIIQLRSSVAIDLSRATDACSCALLPGGAMSCHLHDRCHPCAATSSSIWVSQRRTTRSQSHPLAGRLRRRQAQAEGALRERPVDPTESVIIHDAATQFAPKLAQSVDGFSGRTRLNGAGRNAQSRRSRRGRDPTSRSDDT